MSNKVLTYRLRTFINATHAVRWQGVQGVAHPHTWELILDIQPMTYPQPMKFEDIETVINDSIAVFSGEFLNTVAPFDDINPTLENFAEVLFDILTTALLKISCQLLDLSVGESPTRFINIALAQD